MFGIGRSDLFIAHVSGHHGRPDPSRERCDQVIHAFTDSVKNGSLSLRPVTGQQVVDREGFLRAERTRVGAWLASIWTYGLLAAILIEIPLQLDSYYLYDQTDARFGAISGFNLSLTTVCLILLYAQWLPRLVVESQSIRVSKPLAVYLAIVASSILWTGDKSRTVFEAFLLFQAFLIFVYLVNNLKTKRDILFVITFLAIGLAIQGTLMSATKVLSNDIQLGPIPFDYLDRTGRVAGSFGSPNVAASFIALLFVPCLSLLLMDVSRPLKLIALFAISISSFAIVATLSRGGWLATGISMTIFGIVALRNGWLSRWILAFLLLMAVVAAVVFYEPLASRLLGDDGGSINSRTPLMELSGNLILEYPFGVGANTWDLAVEQQAASGNYRGDWFFFVHNKYLLVLAEIGWIGFFAFMAFLGSTVLTGWRGLKSCEPGLAPLLLALTAAFVGQTFHMAFDIFNSRVQVQMICLVAGLIFAISAITATASTRRAALYQPSRPSPDRSNASL